jgi:hypothetical protein
VAVARRWPATCFVTVFGLLASGVEEQVGCYGREV